MEEIKEVAASVACDFIYRPTDEKYTDEHIRKFQGCPTIAVTRGGRIYMAWYSGGICEPHIENFNLIIYSDDGGANWSKPYVVIPSSRERLVHALDIELYTAPDGRLFVYWVQNNVKPADALDKDGNPLYHGYTIEGIIFNDSTHAMWYAVCDAPDADEPIFSAPKYADIGFLRCKPLALDSNRWICFNYDQGHDRYGYSITEDAGKTYQHHYGAKKIPSPFDEAMAYRKKNGDIRLFARTTNTGYLAESTSHDGGLTWDEAKNSDVVSPSTRLFVAKTPSGRVLLVHNEHPNSRTNMTVKLSEDDGVTWKYSRCIDTRGNLSYPDVDFYDGHIYLTYDRERTGVKEILFVDFTEEDIIDNTRPIHVKVVSKP